MITYHKLTTYYLQGNEQAKSTNKTLGKILTKLVNANWMDTLCTYRLAYKMTIQYTPLSWFMALNQLCQQNLQYQLKERAWTWAWIREHDQFFLKNSLHVDKILKNILSHLGHNIWWCGKIFYHVSWMNDI